jgi:hypothetical protein
LRFGCHNIAGLPIPNNRWSIFRIFGRFEEEFGRFELIFGKGKKGRNQAFLKKEIKSDQRSVRIFAREIVGDLRLEDRR